MVVSRSNFKEMVLRLSVPGVRSVDTETTGLRPYHGDRLFSIIIADDTRAYYFNFQKYPDVDDEWCLPREWIQEMRPIFENSGSTWEAHKAKFDAVMLAMEGLEIAGEIHDTKVAALLEYNEHFDYSLDACGARIGEKKDDTVERYIDSHRLFTSVKVPGKLKVEKRKHFDRVPFDIIVPYGEQDGIVCHRLAQHQKAAFQRLDQEAKNADGGDSLPSVFAVFRNESRLAKTTLRMERFGVRIDPGFCREASSHERARADKAREEFKKLTGDEYSDSPKLFERVFAADRDRWGVTEKGNPSFNSEALANFEHPAAQCILTYRDAKSKADFYLGFIYHADREGRVHPNLNQDGAGHGRFSSSEPNFQNLTSSDEEEVKTERFIVRRAIIPEPGFLLVGMDYNQVEYRFLLDRAGEDDLARKIMAENLDVHQATAIEAGISRSDAKNVNFGLVYGQGDKALALKLKKSRDDAKRIRAKVLGIMPNVAAYNREAMETARNRGWLINWMGRRLFFPNPEFAYTSLNYLVAGGCADLIKLGMNRLDDFLADKKSRLILNVHDENLFEVHPSELWIIPILLQIMQDAYPGRVIKLTCGVEWSDRSWADMVEGIPA